MTPNSPISNDAETPAQNNLTQNNLTQNNLTQNNLTQNNLTMPDRLSVNPNSPFYNEEILAQGVGIKFRGEERTNVEEYCISENWVRVALGNKVDRKGNPLCVKHSGEVIAYIKG